MSNGKLTYGVEFTRNLGNFENVKPKFELTIDVDYLNTDELNELKESLAETVDAWLVQKVEELETELKALGLGK